MPFAEEWMGPRMDGEPSIERKPAMEQDKDLPPSRWSRGRRHER